MQEEGTWGATLQILDSSLLQLSLLICSSAGKEPACNAGDPGSIPGLEDPLERG